MEHIPVSKSGFLGNILILDIMKTGSDVFGSDIITNSFGLELHFDISTN